ncbi:MAG: hypothetical protein QOK37_4024 [Thermoanaerobaculia bacterium]|jgi:hypothetical protein|nr:hypothetical protein [Thermoanaerobaculia bacterium]
MMKIAIASFLLVVAGSVQASQPLETETARLLPAGVFKFELTGEYQTSSDGTERSVPLVFEYGLTPRTEIAVEPVFATSIRSKSGSAANGPGDLEVTLTHLLLPEGSSTPAFALAGEIKLPTAKNRQIGTGKTDLTAWAIASKRFGRVDIHGNLGYTIIGKPAGAQLKNIISYAAAGEMHVSPRFDIVGELIGNTSSTGESADGTSGSGTVISSEAPGGETSVMAGVRWHLRPDVFVSIGVSYDNNHALLIRPGITWRFGGR